MKEGKIYYQDEEVFLKTCNYVISLVVDPATNELLVGPYTLYFNYAYSDNQAELTKHLHAHFKLIKDMGFNSVRIMNASIQPRHDSDNKLAIKSLNWPLPTYSDPIPNATTTGNTCFNYENLNENGMDYLLFTMQTILDIADIYGLKVIWVLGTESRYFDGEKKYNSLLNYTNDPIHEAYSQALMSIGYEFRSHPALFAYELFHENESFIDSEMPDGMHVNQVSLANSVFATNDVIQKMDPNHYTTVGMFDVNQFFKLGVKPFYYTDFLNFHFYERDPYEFFNVLPEGSSLNRQLYYLNRTVEYPWMIGENGTETNIDYMHEQLENIFSVDETMQREVTQNILNYSDICGSIGYTYWQFSNAMGLNNYGVMKFSETQMPVEINTNPYQTVNCNLDYKQIVDPANISIFNMVTSGTGTCTCNSNIYYDVRQTPSTGNPTYTGIVKCNNVPVKDAIIKLTYSYDEDGDGEGELKDLYTFTNSQGKYNLSLPNAVNDHARLSVSKYGYDVYYDPYVLSASYKTVNINSIYFPQKTEYDRNIEVPHDQIKVIDYERVIPDKIIINENATLVIKDTIYFDKNAYLLINNGGKLILEEGACLTAINGTWQGIKINSDGNNMPQLVSNGKSGICNAEMGIIAHGNVRIDMYKTDFIDNHFDVVINSNELTKSLFDKCNFVTTAYVSDYYISNSAVRISNTIGCKFTDCYFIDERFHENGPKRTAIQSDAWSRIEVIGQEKKCIFKNLYMGIFADNYSELYMSNAEFIDNTHDMYLVRMKGTTLVYDCNFLINENAPLDPNPNIWYPYHVKLNICEPVYFYNCDFKDNRPEANTKPIKTGIEAVYVQKLKIAPSPMIQIHRSSFNNLLYGVCSVSETGNSLEITNTDFITSRGIETYGYSGFGSLKILNNNFTIKDYYLNIQSPEGEEASADEVYRRPYGIYLKGLTNTFVVEGNKFISENNDFNLRFGIVTKNTGAVANEIYRNDFSTLENSLQAIGRNGETGTNPNNAGMEFICNKFSNCRTDIFITPDYSYPTAEIARIQGDENRPAGNLFSTNASAVSIRNDIYDITYFTRKLDDPNFDIREIPINVFDGEAMVNIQQINFIYEDEMCPDNTGNVFKPVRPVEERASLDNSLLLEDAIDDMLDDIVDGGNTGQILSSILHLDDNSAWLTYYELMFISPYLSDTVLKEVAKKELGLTAPMIRDILVANPQSAKKSDIKKLLKDRNIELPEYMISQIESGANIMSPKEHLDIQKAQQRKIFDNSLMTLVNYYYQIKDSVDYANDSIIELLTIREEPKYMLLLSEYIASTGEYKEASNILENILVHFDLSRYEYEEITSLISYYDAYPGILKRCKGDILNLDSKSIGLLKEFAHNDDMSGYKARALLLANGEGCFVFPVYEPGIIVSPRSAKINNEPHSLESYMSIYPNPAKEYINVEYKLAEQKGTLQIVITDLTGKIILEQELFEIQDIVIINTTDLKEGTYNCSLFNGNSVEFNNKIVIRQ
ncbi:MAG TPA: T9SS type A sorting domain-containing protein [Bacteroidales bacterium]|nr:T9SS type A sorting domain-containing protein [Bacteroidales bacterium]